MQNLAESRANAIQAKLQNALDSARTMANTLERVKVRKARLTLSREQINTMLLSVLKDNPRLQRHVFMLGTGCAGRPGPSLLRINEGGNNPLTGRFTPYWTRRFRWRYRLRNRWLSTTPMPATPMAC